MRSIRVWTWEIGERDVDLDGSEVALASILENVLAGGLWKQFRKFPPATLRRLLPHLNIANNTRRLVELWIEEAPARETAR